MVYEIQDNARHRMKRMIFKNLSLAGCGVVMLAALGLALASGTSNWGFPLLVLCPLMHIFLHRHLHSGADRLEAGSAKMPWATGRQDEDGHSSIAVRE